MKRALAFVLLGLLCSPALAQYTGPAVEACRTYAQRELPKDGPKGREVLFERDQSLIIERYTKKLGSQLVSSILMGNGAIVLDDAPSIELSFLCLLADDKRPLFFQWLGRQGAPAITQCTRSEVLRAKPRACLDYMLKVAEQDLTQVYAAGFQDARERDAKRTDELFTTAYRKSNAEWLQYRDAECARRRDLAPAGIAAEDFQLACVIDLTRRRGSDMR